MKNTKVEYSLIELRNIALVEGHSYIMSQLKSLNDIKQINKIVKQVMPFDYQTFFQLFEATQQSAEKLKNQVCWVLLGPTGAGKSTSIHYLCGSHFQRADSGSVIVKSINEMIAGKDIKIGQNVTESCTRLIEAVEFDLSKYENDIQFGYGEAKQILLVDTPGFEDTAGPEVNIANSIGTIRALKKAKAVKIIVTFKEAHLEDKFKHMRNIAQNMGQTIKKLERELNKSNGSSIVGFLTKSSHGMESARIMFTEAYNEQGEKDENGLFKALIRKLGKVGNSYEIKIDVENDTNNEKGRVKILKSLVENTGYITATRERFTEFISESALHKLQQQVDINYNTIKNILDNYFENSKYVKHMVEILSDLHKLKKIIKNDILLDKCIDGFQNKWNGRIMQANNILGDLDIKHCNVDGLEDKLKQFADIKTIITENMSLIKEFEYYKEYELKDEYCLNDGLHKCFDVIYEIIIESLQTIASKYSMKSEEDDEPKNDSYGSNFDISFIEKCCRKYVLLCKHIQQNENDEYIRKKIQDLETLVDKIGKDVENTLNYVLRSESSQNLIDVQKFTLTFLDLSKLNSFLKVMNEYSNDSSHKSSKIINIANASIDKLKSNIKNKIKHICRSYSLNEMNTSVDKLKKFNITNRRPYLRRARSLDEIKTSTQLQLNDSHTAPNPRNASNDYVNIDMLLKSNLRKTNDEMISRENTLVSFSLWLNQIYNSLSQIDISDAFEIWLDSIKSKWIEWLCNACKCELKACNNLLFNDGPESWNYVQTLLVECESLRKVDEVANDYEISIEYFKTIGEFASRKTALAKDATQLINERNINYDKIIRITNQLCDSGCGIESNEIKQICDQLQQYLSNLRSKIETIVLTNAINNDSYDILIEIETILKELNSLQTFATIMPNIQQDSAECYKMLNDHMLIILNQIKLKYDMKYLKCKLPLNETHSALKFLNKCKIIKWNLTNKFEQKANAQNIVLSNEYVSKIYSTLTNYLHAYGNILESNLNNLINKLGIKSEFKCDLNNEEYVETVRNTVTELTNILREFRDISNFDQKIIDIYANNSKQSKRLKLTLLLFTNPDIQLDLYDYINHIISEHKQGILMNIDQSKIHRIDKLPGLYFMCTSMIKIDRYASPKNQDNTYSEMASRINDELIKFCNNKSKQIIPLFENGPLYQLKDILATFKKIADADQRGTANKMYGHNLSQLLDATFKLIHETKTKLSTEINKDNNDVTDHKILDVNNQLNRVKNMTGIICCHLCDQTKKDMLQSGEKSLGKFVSIQLMKLMQEALKSAQKRDFLKCEKLLNNTSKFMDRIDTQFYIDNIEQKDGFNIDNTIVIQFRKIAEQVNEELDKILQQVTLANRSLTDPKVFYPYNRLQLVTLYDQLTTSQNEKFSEIWYQISNEILHTIKHALDEIKESKSAILDKIEMSLPKFPNEMKEIIHTMLKQTKENFDEIQTILDTQAPTQQRFRQFTHGPSIGSQPRDIITQQIAKPSEQVIRQEKQKHLEQIQKYMRECVKKAGGGGLRMSELGNIVHKRFHGFDRRLFLSSRKATFSDFVRKCPGLAVIERKGKNKHMERFAVTDTSMKINSKSKLQQKTEVVGKLTDTSTTQRNSMTNPTTIQQQQQLQAQQMNSFQSAAAHQQRSQSMRQIQQSQPVQSMQSGTQSASLYAGSNQMQNMQQNMQNLQQMQQGQMQRSLHK